MDFCHNLAINKDGLVSICTQFNPKGLSVIGDANNKLLSEIWNSIKRLMC